jgi:hypothetical protein
MLMSTYGEGPIMGLKEGWISMGEPVSWAGRVSLLSLPEESKRTILDNLNNKYYNLGGGENIDNPWYPSLRFKHPHTASPILAALF